MIKNDKKQKALKEGIREAWFSFFKRKFRSLILSKHEKPSSTSKAKSRGARRNNKPNKNLGFNHRSIPRSKSRRGSKLKTLDGRQKPRERSIGKCKKTSSRRKESIRRMKRGAVFKRSRGSTKRSTTLIKKKLLKIVNRKKISRIPLKFC